MEFRATMPTRIRMYSNRSPPACQSLIGRNRALFREICSNRSAVGEEAIPAERLRIFQRVRTEHPLFVPGSDASELHRVSCRSGDIPLELCLQLVDRRELMLVAKPGYELDADLLSIEIPVII